MGGTGTTQYRIVPFKYDIFVPTFGYSLLRRLAILASENVWDICSEKERDTYPKKNKKTRERDELMFLQNRGGEPREFIPWAEGQQKGGREP